MSSLILVFAVAVGALGCGRSADDAVTEEDVRFAYSAACAKCHGPNRTGSALAPPLFGLAEHWGEDELVRFLEDPEAMMAGDERLRRMREHYPTIMPTFVMDDGLRRALAKDLLATGPPGSPPRADRH